MNFNRFKNKTLYLIYDINANILYIIKKIKFKKIQTSLSKSCLRKIVENHTTTKNEKSIHCQYLIKLSDNIVIIGSWDNTIKIWNLNNGFCIKTLLGHDSAVLSLVKINENIIASGSNDKTIKIWDISTGKCSKTLSDHIKLIDCLLKLNINQIISASIDLNIKIWDLTTYSCIKSIKIEVDRVICFIKLKQNILVCGHCSFLDIIDIKSDNYQNDHLIFNSYEVINCLVKINDKYIASGGSRCEVIVWEIIDFDGDKLDNVELFNKFKLKGQKMKFYVLLN